MKKFYLLSSLLIIALGINAQSGSQSFTATGTFIVPSGVTTISIELLGAGGSGGGNGGGGGGGGGYASGIYTVTPGDSIYIIIGSAGGGPNGGASTIATLGIFSYGGDNGTSVSNPNLGGGGIGGNAIGGTIANNTGGDGGGGYWTYFGGGGGGAAGPLGNGSTGGNTILWTGNCVTPGGASGASGGAPGGDGGKGAGFTDSNCNVTDPAGNGLNYGGGGGGGNGNGGNAGTGTDGYCYISWGPAGTVTVNPLPVVTVSPNPFTDRIRVQNVNGNETYELLNATGQIVWSGQNIQEQNFSALATGIYMMRVEGDGGVQTMKLLKQ